jgi:RimJ/RimL family protein N-acetyltransferase
LSVPVLTTARLTLRAYTADDLDAFAAIWGDPEVTRHIGGQPRTRPEVWSTLLRNIGHWQALGFGYWVVTQTGTGEVLGEAGFADHRRGLPAGLTPGPEAGWAFGPGAWGKGVATEAMRACQDWIDRTQAPRTTHCIIDPENLASQKVAVKLGYRPSGETLLRGETVLIYRRGA